MDKRSSFGIIAIATTMLGAMLFSSCSHDEFYYSEEKVESLVNEKYAAAFEKAFGKVGPNVDWGFSSKNASTRAFTRAEANYASSRGAIQPTITFPKDCDASNFLKEVPAGVGKLPEGGANAASTSSYYIEGAYNVVSTWSGASQIYVKGTVDLSDNDGDPSATAWRFTPDYRSEIYLLEGSKLILGKNSAKNFNVDAIYIADGATLQSEYSLWANNSTKIYNHGTINVGSFEPNTSSFLYNVGTLKAGNVTAESNSTRIVNDGTINCNSVIVNAGAVQNNYEWTVEGTTKINSNNSGWVNNGKWKTAYYAYIGGSVNVINNCFLWVTEDFEMNISSNSTDGDKAFKMDSGCGVLTKNFYGGRDSSTGAISGPFKIVMGQNSVFKVEETAVLESGRSTIPETAKYEFGFFGPSTGYAVFQAKNIIREESIKNTWGAVTYGGNLYVSAETHFAQGNDGLDSHPYIIENPGFNTNTNIYAAGFTPGKPNITIEETACCPGFKGGNPLYRVIAEDLSAAQAGDFDFNDVVFDVVKYEGGKTTLRLQACGGTLPLKIGSNNGAGGVEVHSLYGETAPDATTGLYKMWNTGYNSHEPVDFEIAGDYTTPEQLLALHIEVQKDGAWMPLTAKKGEAACKILVDNRFTIVPERKSIVDDYGNFTTYVQGYWTDKDGLDDFWWIQK